MKKSYYRLARIYHPDRVAESEKCNAQEKFSIVHKAYCILSDAQERKKYDDGFNVLFDKATKSAAWEHFLKPTTNQDINEAKSLYQNSSKEQKDVEREYRNGKGSMTHLLNTIPFMRYEDEPRITEIIKISIAEGRVQKFKIKKIKK